MDDSKRNNYVSSSDDERESGDDDNLLIAKESSVGPPKVLSNPASGPKTGPKGVIRDYEHYQELREKEEQWKKQQQKAPSRKPPSRMQPVTGQADDDLFAELELELESDPFVNEYREKRLRQMQVAAATAAQHKQNAFGSVVDVSADTFLEVVDNENPAVYVIVHVYDNSVDACSAMNGCLACLASDYPDTKFCRLKASNAQVSHKFESDGLPALLVYRGGQLIGNFVRLSDQLGDDFYASDVENFLVYHNCLPKSDKSQPNLE
ncbi:phosducin-like protein [Corticium candelabrum]|uniref:phosducin-like protein n=1 Tax=Corticium candelabrum TaxID=121492 RepID=UPI002E26518B|nr:phosducin-like protein [Corticium candelabrum]